MGGGTSTTLAEHLETLPEAEKGKLIKLYSTKIAEGATEKDIIHDIEVHLTSELREPDNNKLIRNQINMGRDDVKKKNTEKAVEAIQGAVLNPRLKGARKKSNEMNSLQQCSGRRHGLSSRGRSSSPDSSSRTENSMNRPSSHHEPEMYLLLEEYQKRLVDVAKRNEILQAEINSMKIDNDQLRDRNEALAARLQGIDNVIDHANETERTHKGALERLVKHIEALKGSNDELLKQIAFHESRMESEQSQLSECFVPPSAIAGGSTGTNSAITGQPLLCNTVPPSAEEEEEEGKGKGMGEGGEGGDKSEDLIRKLALTEMENRRLSRDNYALKVTVVEAKNQLVERDETVRLLQASLQKYLEAELAATSAQSTFA